MPQDAPEERARIEQALIDLCVERGYANIQLPDLLREAGIDETTFRRHFTDLEDCFCSFYLPMRDEFMARVGAAFAAEEGWRNQVRAAAWEIAAFIREDLGRARISFVEVWFVGERAKLIRDEAVRGLVALIDLGREARGDDLLSPLTAEFVGSAVYQRLQIAIEKGDIAALEAEVPELMYAVVLPYLGHEAAEEELRMPRPDPV